MKRWRKADEWVAYALCGGNDLFTAEELTDSEMVAVQKICGDCLVRPECIEWALREAACSVVVAGIPLPDPGMKKDLKKIYHRLEDSLPQERAVRGEGI